MLSIYDEYISGYKDRSAICAPTVAAKLIALGNALTHVIVVDGQIVGTWKRTDSTAATAIAMNTFARLTKRETRAIALAADRFGAFLGKKVVLA
jgi:hypothetical protein